MIDPHLDRALFLLSSRSLVRRLLTKQVSITVKGSDAYGGPVIELTAVTVPRNVICKHLIDAWCKLRQPWRRIRGGLR